MIKAEQELYRKYLIRCPFCASLDIDIRWRKVTIIECANCSALIIRKTQEDAMKAWNRRDKSYKTDA